MPHRDFAPFEYETIFISDFHLGSDKTASPYLYEFLKNLNYSKLKNLYLVGDVVGGWEHQNNKQQPLPEMEKRILDVINYAAGNGIQVHFIIGNHDEKIRPILTMLQQRKSLDVFSKNIIFENETMYETHGAVKKKLKVIHGDQHDPTAFVKPWFRPIAKLGSFLYDKLVVLNARLSNYMYSKVGFDFSIARVLQDVYQRSVNSSFSKNSLTEGLKTDAYDGILMGHTHMMSSDVFMNGTRESYLINIGDWVESSTFGGVDANGGLPKVISYKEEREERGFGSLPDEQDEHPNKFAAYRAQTDDQARMIHQFWPAKDRADVKAQYFKSEKSMRVFREDKQKLNNIFSELSASGILSRGARQTLQGILDNTWYTAYRPQKKGLRTIFNKYAVSQPVQDRDVAFTKTILREFMNRCDRKIKEHKVIRDQYLAKLDFPVHSK